jgi:small subunit ribosomal protein S2
MQEYERMKLSGEFDAMPKKEALLLGRELEKLQKNLGGIRRMTKRPDAVFVLDTKKEHIAVTEANKLKIPVVAVVDTNVDPDVVQYPIPGNDDAIRSAAPLTKVVASAVAEGLQARSGAGADKPEAQGAEPLAEWEQELLAGATTAAAAAPDAGPAEAAPEPTS